MLLQEDLIVALTEMLLACGMDDVKRRENVLALIPAEIKQGIVKSESDSDRTAILNMVRRVLEFEEGVEQLVYSIHQVTGGIGKWQELNQFMQKEFPSVATYADRKKLLATAKVIKWPVNVLMQAYVSCIPEGWSRPNFYGVPDLLAYMLKDLVKIGYLGHGTFPVLEFVERLALYAHALENKDVGDGLHSWVLWKALELNSSGFRLKQLQEKIGNTRARDTKKAPSLLILLDTDVSDIHMYNVQAWLLDDQHKVIDIGIAIEDIPRSLENIAQLLGNLLEQILIVESLVDTIDDLVIEFLLPDELLSHDFYRWPIIMGNDEFVLGLQHNVIVRSAERANKRLYWPAWRKKWAQLQGILMSESCSEGFICTCSQESCQAPAGSSSSILVCGREECQARKHLQAALRGSPVVCLALTYAPSCTPLDGDHIFRTLRRVGMPVALWPREPINSAEALISLLSYGALNSLPGKIWECRKNAVIKGDELDIGNFLTLLWDDPFRLPPTATAPQFGAPGKKE